MNIKTIMIASYLQDGGGVFGQHRGNASCQGGSLAGGQAPQGWLLGSLFQVLDVCTAVKIIANTY